MRNCGRTSSPTPWRGQVGFRDHNGLSQCCFKVSFLNFPPFIVCMCVCHCVCVCVCVCVPLCGCAIVWVWVCHNVCVSFCWVFFCLPVKKTNCFKIKSERKLTASVYLK